MAQVTVKPAYKVTIIESERGFGQRVDEVLYFDNDVEAKEYCKRYNAQNTEDSAPDWYMVAQYDGKVEVRY